MSQKWTPNSRTWEAQRNDDIRLTIVEEKTAKNYKFHISGSKYCRIMLDITDAELRSVKQAIADIEQKIKEIEKEK